MRMQLLQRSPLSRRWPNAFWLVTPLALLCGANGCGRQDGGELTPDSGDTSEPSDTDSSGGTTQGSAEPKNSQDPDKDSQGPGATPKGALTYHKDAKRILQAKCTPCHAPGKIAPFDFTTYEKVYDARSMIAHSVEAERMPPWSPAKSCGKRYVGDRSLTNAQKTTLLDWIEQGAHKGQPWNAPQPPKPKIAYNMELSMPEPYTPRADDDNRCFLIEWPGDKVQYQKSFAVEPGQPAMLHHLLVYKVSKDRAQRFKNFDRNDPGPGYTCPGGPAPGVHPNQVQLIGDWVPGQSDQPYPEGIGVKYEPGDLLIFQHHYNTAFTGKLSDQSSYRFSFVDSVEREAAATLFFNDLWLIPGLMLIPPDQKDTSYEHVFDARRIGQFAAQRIPGLSPNEPLQIHFIGPHMHQLGSKAYVDILRADGTEECVVQIDHWDFDWQGFYTLAEPLILQPNDKLRLKCHWDNSAENQPPGPDGKKPAPQMVIWGDRTRDEMCLTGIMVSRPTDR